MLHAALHATQGKLRKHYVAFSFTKTILATHENPFFFVQLRASSRISYRHMRPRNMQNTSRRSHEPVAANLQRKPTPATGANVSPLPAPNDFGRQQLW